MKLDGRPSNQVPPARTLASMIGVKVVFRLSFVVSQSRASSIEFVACFAMTEMANGGWRLRVRQLMSKKLLFGSKAISLSSSTSFNGTFERTLPSARCSRALSLRARVWMALGQDETEHLQCSTTRGYLRTDEEILMAHSLSG